MWGLLGLILHFAILKLCPFILIVHHTFLYLLGLSRLQLDIYSFILLNVFLIKAEVDGLFFLVVELDDLLGAVTFPEAEHAVVDEMFIRINLQVHDFLHEIYQLPEELGEGLGVSLHHLC